MCYVFVKLAQRKDKMKENENEKEKAHGFMNISSGLCLFCFVQCRISYTILISSQTCNITFTCSLRILLNCISFYLTPKY
jgi:hypothetical protein